MGAFPPSSFSLFCGQSRIWTAASAPWWQLLLTVGGIWIIIHAIMCCAPPFSFWIFLRPKLSLLLSPRSFLIVYMAHLEDHPYLVSIWITYFGQLTSKSGAHFNKWGYNKLYLGRRKKRKKKKKKKKRKKESKTLKSCN